MKDRPMGVWGGGGRGMTARGKRGKLADLGLEEKKYPQEGEIPPILPSNQGVKPWGKGEGGEAAAARVREEACKK